MTAPLVPSDVDLRDFGFMPLDVRRLLTSETWIEAADKPKIGHAVMCLWAESWHQVPAASLPDNDKVLARLAMCDAKSWAKIKADVLAGWIKCDDGLLYHPTVAEKALESWEHKVKQRARTKAATEAREAKRQAQQNASHVERDVPRDEQRNVERDVHQGTVKGQGQGTKEQEPTPEDLLRAEKSGGALARSTPTAAGEACLACRRGGLMQTNPAHPQLLAALEEGAFPEQFEHTAREAVALGKGFPWVIATIRGRNRDAATSTTGANHAASPSSGRASLADRVRSTAAPDHHDERDVLEGTATRLTD